MSKNRKNAFNSTTQNIFGNTLQDIYNKRDKVIINMENFKFWLSGATVPAFEQKSAGIC